MLPVYLAQYMHVSCRHSTGKPALFFANHIAHHMPVWRLLGH